MVRPLMMRRSLISETAGAVNTETDTNSAGVAIIDQRENQKCNSQVRHLARRQQNNTRLIRKSFILHTTGSAVDKFPSWWRCSQKGPTGFYKVVVINPDICIPTPESIFWNVARSVEKPGLLSPPLTEHVTINLPVTIQSDLPSPSSPELNSGLGGRKVQI